jgi:hypothetical protein
VSPKIFHRIISSDPSKRRNIDSRNLIRGDANDLMDETTNKINSDNRSRSTPRPNIFHRRTSSNSNTP